MEGREPFTAIAAAAEAKGAAAKAAVAAWSLLLNAGGQLVAVAASATEALPGGAYVGAYVRASYQDDPVRTLLEFMLLLLALKYLLTKRYAVNVSGKLQLTPGEVDALIDEWLPEPLVPPQPPHLRHASAATAAAAAEDAFNSKRNRLHDNEGTARMRPLCGVPSERELLSVPTVSYAPECQRGPRVSVPNLAPGATLYDFCSADHLGLANHPESVAVALDALSIYGVGSCGPPGFYGYSKLHKKLECDLAKFLVTPACDAVLYAQAFSATSSVIPAFAKRGDTIFIDSAISFAAQKGAIISRANLHFFAHNDVQMLAQLLAAFDDGILFDNVLGKSATAKKSVPASVRPRGRKASSRVFVLVEGLYGRTGCLAPLPEIIALCSRYQVRLMLDDSRAFGVLGPRGEGSAAHWELPPDAVHITFGSLAHACGAMGGYCVGNEPAVVDHQRLCAKAYVFSATMPPMMAAAGSRAISLMTENGPEWLARLRSHVVLLRDALASRGTCIQLLSSPLSPLQHVHVCLDTLPLSALQTLVLRVLSNQMIGGCGFLKNSVDYVDNFNGLLSDIADGLFEAPEYKAYCKGSQFSAPLPENIKSTDGTMSSRFACTDWKKAPFWQRQLFVLEAEFLEMVVEEGLRRGVLVSRAKYNVEQEIFPPRPSLEINVTLKFNLNEIGEAAVKLADSFDSVFRILSKE